MMLLRMRPGRLLIAVAAATVVAVLGAGVVHANSVTGSQNPRLTVYVSITPDCLTPGGVRTRYASVTNNTAKADRVTLGFTVAYAGQVYYTAPPRTLSLRPGQTLVLQNLTGSDYPAQGLGSYAETRSATDSGGTSSATATYTFASSC